MKKINIVIFIIIGFLVSFCGQNKKVYDEGYLVKVGDMAPDFTIKEAGGKTYQLSSLRGSVVMLQFTASWCSVCRTEMPFIEKDIWQKKKDEGLIVIGIDRDEPVDVVNKFHDDMHISYPLALDSAANIFGLYAQKDAGVTRNVIIDRDGKIIFLTRLFEEEEFNAMKRMIFNEIAPNKK